VGKTPTLIKWTEFDTWAKNEEKRDYLKIVLILLFLNNCSNKLDELEDYEHLFIKFQRKFIRGSCNSFEALILRKNSSDILRNML